MIRLELIIVNLLQFTNIAAPGDLVKTVIETKENSNLRICIQYLRHHAKDYMPKISQIDEVPCQAKVRILQKISLNYWAACAAQL